MCDSTKDKFELPESLDWYRQSANWLVGLASGALAITASLAEKLIAQGRISKILFTFEGLSFLVTILCGVTFHFLLVSYGNSLELKHWAPPEQKESFQRRIGDAAASYPKFYYAMVISFAAGAIFLALLAFSAILPGQKSGISQEVIILPEASQPIALYAEGPILLVDRKLGEVWEVRKTPQSGWIIRKVQQVMTGPPNPRAASPSSSSSAPLATSPTSRKKP